MRSVVLVSSLILGMVATITPSFDQQQQTEYKLQTHELTSEVQRLLQRVDAESNGLRGHEDNLNELSKRHDDIVKSLHQDQQTVSQLQAESSAMSRSLTDVSQRISQNKQTLSSAQRRIALLAEAKANSHEHYIAKDNEIIVDHYN